MRRTTRLALPVLASVFLASCGGDDPILPGADTGPLTAFIDGDPFVAEFATVNGDGVRVLVNAGASGERTISFEFPDVGSANHLIGPGNPVSAEVTIGTSSWLAEETTGSGTITVTAYGPRDVEGSFTLSVEGGPNQTTLNVTAGRFVIPLYQP